MASAVRTQAGVPVDYRRANPSEIIPIEDLTLDERRNKRANVDQMLVEYEIAAGVAPDETSLVLREVLPFTDLGMTGNTSSDTWLDTALGTAGTEHQLFSYTLKIFQAIVAYGFGAPQAGVSNISRARIGLGSGTTPAVIRQTLQLEPLWNRLVPVGYLGVPSGWKPQQIAAVNVMPFRSYAASSEFFLVLSRIADRLSDTISGPTL